MKFLVNILCMAIAIAHTLGQEVTIPVGESGLDTLTTIRNFDSAGNYDVGYNENQLTGGASFYREKGYANGTREGSYGYTTRNGLIRIVTYIADHNGYRAELMTNEPGIGAENSADVKVTKEQEPDAEALAQGPTGTSSNSASLGTTQQGPGVLQQSSGGSQLGSGGSQLGSGSSQLGSGAAQQSLDVPYQGSQQNYANPPMYGVSQQSIDVPYQGYGTPQQKNGNSQGFGVPQQGSGVQQQGLGVQQQGLGVQQYGSGVLQQNNPIPQETGGSQQYSESSVVYAAASDVIRDYVTAPASKGSAQVRVVTPHMQYQYNL